MARNNGRAARQIRELLRSAPDGLTTMDLSRHTRRDPRRVRDTLAVMPDVYIDHWTRSLRDFVPVWSVVVPPPDCPKPDKITK